MQQVYTRDFPCSIDCAGTKIPLPAFDENTLQQSAKLPRRNGGVGYQSERRRTAARVTGSGRAGGTLDHRESVAS
jgi:hypothetical protein